MNKTVVVIVAVVILILLGGGGAYTMMNRTGTKSQKSENTVSKKPAQSGNVKKSFRDLFSIGENQECTFSDTTAGSHGTIYIGSNELRGDFESNVNNKTVRSHIIQDRENMYVWTDNEKQGFKVARDSVEKAVENMGDVAVDLNKEADYSCKTWSVDTGVFSLPSDVEFQDYSKMMEGAGEFMNSASGTPAINFNCSACDSLSGDAKASCLTALKCD